MSDVLASREVVDQEDSPCPYTGAGASWKDDVFLEKNREELMGSNLDHPS